MLDYFVLTDLKGKVFATISYWREQFIQSEYVGHHDAVEVCSKCSEQYVNDMWALEVSSVNSPYYGKG